MIRWITLLLLLLSSLPGYGQQASYVNHTELGPLLGKMNDTDRRVNFSIQSFNGIRIRPNLSVGFLIGMDSYPGFVLMPMAMGWRGVLDKGKRTSLYASLDVGYGSAILEEKQRENFLESWYEGGLMFSPAIGLHRKSKSRRHAFTWSIGFKHQKASFYEGTRIQGLSRDSNDPKLPPGFGSVRQEAYLLNSLFIKWGIAF